MLSTAKAIGAIVEVHPLTNPDDEAKAAQLLRAIKTIAAEGEDARKAAKAPFLQGGQAIDEQFRPARQALDRVEKLIKRRLSEAAEARAVARAAAIAEAQAAAAVGDHAAANAAIETISDPVFAPVGISERWTYEVESYDARAVPPEYLILNADRVRAEIRLANQEGRPPAVPGIVFRNVAGIAARRF